MYIQANTKDILYYYIQRKYNQPSGGKEEKKRDIILYIGKILLDKLYIYKKNTTYIYKKNTQSPLGERKREKRCIVLLYIGKIKIICIVLLYI